jgi:hypothetical protein
MAAIFQLASNYIKTTMILLLFFLGFLINSYDPILIQDSLNETSLDVRIDQAIVFLQSITITQFLSGAGYASETEIGMQVGQTSIYFRYLLYFGFVRTLLLIILIGHYIGYKLISQKRIQIFLVALLIASSSLDITLSSMFVGTFLAAIQLFKIKQCATVE